MTCVTRLCLVSLLAALPSAAVAAGKYSWFDDVSTDSAAVRARPSAFDTDVYHLLRDVPAERAVARDQVKVYGDYAPRQLSYDDSESSARRFANFGVRWQHHVSSQERVALSAQQADSVLLNSSTANPDTLDTRATVSWTRDLPWSWKPSITGGVFLGGESARDEAARQYGRRYYGFTVGGEMKLLQAHTPYVSFRMERSLYDLPDSAAVNGSAVATSNGSTYTRATDDSSRLAAGWRWQVQRGWSMQAEASYGFAFDNHSELLLQDRERSRVFFGTRFDFR